MAQKRDRAWRRFRRKQCINRRKAYAETKFDGQLSKSKNHFPKRFREWREQKNWKLLYIRSVKQIRARQLGFEYPYYVWRKNQDLDEVSTAIKP